MESQRQEPLAKKRERLKKILGIVDERVKPNLEYISGPGKPSLVAEIDGCKVHAVRWAVLPGIDAEGFLIEPKEKPKANVVYLGGVGVGRTNLPYDLEHALHGCRVLVPTLIDRDDDLSSNARLKRQTNIPHREFVYRMAYEMGRTLTGYEVQKVLAAVDWFTQQSAKLPVGVIGYDDGGMIAYFAGAIDDRVRTTGVWGYFAPRERVHDWPIDHNLWGLLGEFGDAEIARLYTGRGLHFRHTPPLSRWDGPVVRPGRGGAAPGKLAPVMIDGQVQAAELKRITGEPVKLPAGNAPDDFRKGFLSDLGVWVSDDFVRETAVAYTTKHKPQPDPGYAARHKRQFDQLVSYIQKLWRDSDAVRKEYWKNADASSPQKWETSCETYRNYFHSEVIGKLPEPTKPLNPRTRQVYDEKLWTGHEVVLDVYDDVIAYGILLLPKDMKPGEKRPVVVCQHGLEGRPDSICNPNETKFYRSFGSKLADMGYIVYAPQNPYIFENHFRQIQRKANPLKLSLFSFIIRQHQRTLDWLETLPQVEKTKIGFYGLSYGGKTAMRVPAIEKRYCLSICSGDFNEWIGKNVSVDLDRSYMWTGEYEMYEFDLGNTFNYAEMAYLIAPRPFMVERGHNDGVGTDEMVAYEYAKVRYLYAQRLKIPERTIIDFQPGAHEIFLKGTKDFLIQHLGKPKQ